jgi:hypothetical protein
MGGVYIYNEGEKNARSEPVNDLYDDIKKMTPRDRGIFLSRIDALKDGVKTLYRDLGGGVKELKLNNKVRVYVTELGDPEHGGGVVVLYASNEKDHGAQDDAIAKARGYRADLMRRIKEERESMQKAAKGRVNGANGETAEVTDEQVLNKLLRPSNSESMARSLDRKSGKGNGKANGHEQEPPSSSRADGNAMRPQPQQQQQLQHTPSAEETARQDAQRAARGDAQTHASEASGKPPQAPEPAAHSSPAPAKAPSPQAAGAAEAAAAGEAAGEAAAGIKPNLSSAASGVARSVPAISGVLNAAEFGLNMRDGEKRLRAMIGKEGVPANLSSEAISEYGQIVAMSRLEQGLTMGMSQAMGLRKFLEWGEKNGVSLQAMEQLNPTGISKEDFEKIALRHGHIPLEAQAETPDHVRPLPTPVSPDRGRSTGVA